MRRIIKLASDLFFGLLLRVWYVYESRRFLGRLRHRIGYR